MDPTIPQNARIDTAEVYRMADEGYSQGAIGRALGCGQSHISRLLKKRRIPTTNGDLPALRTPVHSSAPECASALPVHPSASALDDLQARVATLEAFMSALQERQRITVHPSAPALSSAPERTEPPTWKSQGQQFAADTLQRLDAYARQSRREKREIIDAALRAYLPPADEGVRHG